jgi:hypothetical protein
LSRKLHEAKLRTLSKVALIAVPFAIAGLVAAFLLTRDSDEPPPLAIAYRDIAEIVVYPVPEGVPPPPLIRHPKQSDYASPLAGVRADIPSPFPAPVQCDYSGDFGSGLQLRVKLRHGRKLDYFSCAFPTELRKLLDDAFSTPPT